MSRSAGGHGPAGSLLCCGEVLCGCSDLLLHYTCIHMYTYIYILYIYTYIYFRPRGLRGHTFNVLLSVLAQLPNPSHPGVLLLNEHFKEGEEACPKWCNFVCFDFPGLTIISVWWTARRCGSVGPSTGKSFILFHIGCGRVEKGARGRNNCW